MTEQRQRELDASRVDRTPRHDGPIRLVPGTEVNLHVFTLGSTEISRMIAFRDRLRTDAGDRARYAAEKRRLAARSWDFMQDYADAKGPIVEAIVARAHADDQG